MAVLTNCKKVLDYIKSNPNCSMTSISETIGVHYYQIRDIIDFLEDINLIEVEDKFNCKYVKCKEVAENGNPQ
jgi:DNA-binding MarR family transcriptional regulator